MRIEHTRDSEKTTRTENHGATLSGGSVKLEAEKDVTFSGSKLVADKGDASVSGNKVSFTAADDKTTSNTEQTKIGGGFYYTGGIDKLGSGVEVGYENSKTQAQSSKAVTSGSDVKGNLTVNARDKLTQQGAQHSVGGAYQENAAGVDHLAAADTASSTTTKTDVGVNIGANVDYSAVTRPVERAVGKAAKLDATGVINDIGGIGAPNVGTDIGAQGGSSETRSSSSQAVVSSVKAGSIDINAKGEVRDQGTQYQASKGAVTLTADSHRSEAATNRPGRAEPRYPRQRRRARLHLHRQRSDRRRQGRKAAPAQQQQRQPGGDRHDRRGQRHQRQRETRCGLSGHRAERRQR